MNIQQIDNAVLNWWQSHQTTFLTENFINFTALGSVTVLSIFLLTWVIQAKKKAEYGLICILWCLLIVEFLKLYIDRSRPHPDHLIIPMPTSPSCPSGHSAMSMAVYMIAASYARRSFLVPMAFLLSILIGCSRMYFGVHYFSDVVLGWSIGLMTFLFFRWIGREKEEVLPK